MTQPVHQQRAQQLPGVVPNIPVAPLPTAVNVSALSDAEGNKWILVTFTTPQGLNRFWYGVEEAEALVMSLHKSIRACKTGLIIPEDNPLILPGGQRG